MHYGLILQLVKWHIIEFNNFPMISQLSYVRPKIEDQALKKF